jgi:hypothetical protein
MSAVYPATMFIRLLITTIVLSTLFVPIATAQDRFTLDLEAGAAWQLRNDFAVPGDTGTRVGLDEKGPAFSGRATLNWNVNERWSVRFLAAPLSSESDYLPAADVSFQSAVFAAGTPIRVDYRFDSYRVGGVYRFRSSGPWSFRAGLTAKVRDAEISLRNEDVSATKSNTGVVPLLYGGARYEASERVALDFDVDGAAAPQGRAIDAALRIETRVTDRTSFFVGGRLLDGGADNDEVYSFATFGYAIAGAQFRW